MSTVEQTTGWSATSILSSSAPSMLDMGDGTLLHLWCWPSSDPIIYKSTDGGKTWTAEYTFTSNTFHASYGLRAITKYQDGATTRVFTAFINSGTTIRWGSFTYSGGTLTRVDDKNGVSGSVWQASSIAVTPDPDVTNGEVIHVVTGSGSLSWKRMPVAANGTLGTESSSGISFASNETAEINLVWDHNGDGFTPARTNAVDMKLVFGEREGTTMYVNHQRLYHTGTGGWQLGTARQWAPGGVGQASSDMGEVGVDCDGTDVYVVIAGASVATNVYVGKGALSSDAMFTQLGGPWDGKFATTRRTWGVRYRDDIDALDVSMIFPSGLYSFQVRDLSGTPTMHQWPLNQSSWDFGHPGVGYTATQPRHFSTGRAPGGLDMFRNSSRTVIQQYPIPRQLALIPGIDYGWATIDWAANSIGSGHTVQNSGGSEAGTMLFHFIAAVNGLSQTPFSILAGSGTKLLDEKTGDSLYPRLATFWRWRGGSTASTTYQDGESSQKIGCSVWVKSKDLLETPDPTFVTVSESRTNGQTARIPPITVPSAGLIIGAVVQDTNASYWEPWGGATADKWHMQNVSMSLLLVASFVTAGGTYGGLDLQVGNNEYSASNLVFIPIGVLAGIDNWGWVPIG